MFLPKQEVTRDHGQKTQYESDDFPISLLHDKLLHFLSLASAQRDPTSKLREGEDKNEALAKNRRLRHGIRIRSTKGAVIAGIDWRPREQKWRAFLAASGNKAGLEDFARVLHVSTWSQLPFRSTSGSHQELS